MIILGPEGVVLNFYVRGTPLGKQEKNRKKKKKKKEASKPVYQTSGPKEPSILSSLLAARERETGSKLSGK